MKTKKTSNNLKNARELLALLDEVISARDNIREGLEIIAGYKKNFPFDHLKKDLKIKGNVTVLKLYFKLTPIAIHEEKLEQRRKRYAEKAKERKAIRWREKMKYAEDNDTIEEFLKRADQDDAIYMTLPQYKMWRNLGGGV